MFYKLLEKFQVLNEPENAERDKYLTQWRTNVPAISHMPNMLITGSQGVGKYHFVLSLLQHLSPSRLRIYKKICVETKNTYLLPASDIHYEVDFSQMIINAKTIWMDILKSITDIITSNDAVIVCKNIHQMNEELLDIFYYLMPKTETIKWIFISEHVDFIPNEIIHICEHISLKRPTKQFYMSLREKIQHGEETPHARLDGDIENIINTQMIHDTIPMDTMEKIHYVKDHPTHILENEIVHSHTAKMTDAFGNIPIAKTLASIIIKNDDYNIVEIREQLYHILTYHIPLEDVMMAVYEELVKERTTIELTETHMMKICALNLDVLNYYKNNYRPIYHLEKWFYSLVEILYKDKTK
jgi:DNA polymerase III delta prime subunit